LIWRRLYVWYIADHRNKIPKISKKQIQFLRDIGYEGRIKDANLLTEWIKQQLISMNPPLPESERIKILEWTPELGERISEQFKDSGAGRVMF
jgi:hypothetical protein